MPSHSVESAHVMRNVRDALMLVKVMVMFIVGATVGEFAHAANVALPPAAVGAAKILADTLNAVGSSKEFAQLVHMTNVMPTVYAEYDNHSQSAANHPLDMARAQTLSKPLLSLMPPAFPQAASEIAVAFDLALQAPLQAPPLPAAQLSPAIPANILAMNCPNYFGAGPGRPIITFKNNAVTDSVLQSYFFKVYGSNAKTYWDVFLGIRNHYCVAIFQYSQIMQWVMRNNSLGFSNAFLSAMRANLSALVRFAPAGASMMLSVYGMANALTVNDPVRVPNMQTIYDQWSVLAANARRSQ